MKNPIIATFCTLSVIWITSSCDSMKTEMDVASSSFPPKLCVTAILDAGSGNFSIALKEGRALADYAKPLSDNREIIRNGEIRLFEDDRRILTISGPFDMSTGSTGYYGYDEYYRNGYRNTISGIVARPGSTYRLEIDAEGYQSVTFTSVMPALPAVSAVIDTSVRVTKKNVTTMSSLGHGAYYRGWTDQYWPISVRLTDNDPTVRDYFAFELNQSSAIPGEGFEIETYACALGMNDLSMLQDNPDMEAQGMLMDSERVDLYLFPLLLLSDLTFSGESSSFTLHTMASSRRYYDESYYKDDPNYEKVFSHHKLTLRVKHITTAAFKYYRSLSLQREGLGFFTEPVNIIGNIENGYGSFSVYSSTDIQLLEYDSYEYRYVERY